jgi:CheY-like chemotaxis protein
MSRRSLVILMADDDADDCLMTREALATAGLRNELRTVSDGQELMEYLLHQGKYTDPASAPRPGLILLDLNMPRKNGHEALQEIKSHPDLKRIPVVILTTSQAEQDVYATYSQGANSYIAKPVSFENLVKIMETIGSYWLEIVTPPGGEERA